MNPCCVNVDVGVSFSRAQAPGLCLLIDTLKMEKNIKVPPKAEAGVFCCRVIYLRLVLLDVNHLKLNNLSPFGGDPGDQELGNIALQLRVFSDVPDLAESHCPPKNLENGFATCCPRHIWDSRFHDLILC